jgi:acetyl-CoA synthetase
VPLSNPLDYHTYAWGDRARLTACFAAMLSNRFACTILVLDYPAKTSAEIENWRIAEDALVDAVGITNQKAVIVSTLPESMPADVRTRLKVAGMTAMQGLEECLFAIHAAAEVGRAQQDAARILPVLEPDPVAGSPEVLDEWQSKTELAGHGLPVPDGALCAADDTVQAANKLGYPVVLKAVRNAVFHKSDVGAVLINLGDATAVQNATASMQGRFERFIVEKMAGPTIAEVLVGVNHDPVFGLTLILGSGGVLVELLDDTVSLLLPLQRHEVVAAIDALKVSRLLRSFRGAETGDTGALVEAILRVGDYAVANKARLSELEINPLLVLARGAMVVDACIQKIPVKD